MAEQFVIRVQVDGQRSTTQGRSNWNESATGSALLLGGALSSRAQADHLGKMIGKLQSKFMQPGDTRFTTDPVEDTIERKGIIFQKTSAMFDVHRIDKDGVTSRGQFYEETRQLNPTLVAHQTKILTGATALALKGQRTAISLKQHRSGDSFYNDQLNNSMKLTQYGLALGYGALKGGPIGFGVVAAGIAINEGINLAVQNANFNYDRKMDTLYIHNITQTAGDISYGRRRGGN